MDDVNSLLIDWSIRFLENKDATKGDIVKIEKNFDGFDFIIHYKDKIKYFILSLTLGDIIFNTLKNDRHCGIFTLNNAANISFVISNWKQLVGYRFLNIYFVNPFSNLDRVWAICPNIHDKVCDKDSLKKGLKSMSEMVAPLGLEELNNKIKLLRKGFGQ